MKQLIGRSQLKGSRRRLTNNLEILETISNNKSRSKNLNLIVRHWQLSHQMNCEKLFVKYFKSKDKRELTPEQNYSRTS